MNLLKNTIDIFIPKRCYHCKSIINTNFNLLCVSCSLELEGTSFFNYTNNPLEKLFLGKVEVKEASALYFYYKDSPIQTLLKQLKYNNLQLFGIQSADLVISELKKSNRFNNIDLVVPVPLHPKKEQKRGYNQIELFGKKIAEYLGVPFQKDFLIKTQQNESQTHQNKENRYKNVEQLFKANTKILVNCKHLLIVDDVLTTGATLTSCAKSIKQQYNVDISIITIACVV